MTRTRHWPALALVIALSGPATAADTGAVGNGGWSNVGTWTNGVPYSGFNAYIGSTDPTGAASAAAVTLNAASQANTVYLGHGPGTAGTLDLNGSYLTANNLYLGDSGGAGSILRTGGGTLIVNSAFYQSTGSFTFGPNDQAAQLFLSNGSSAATVNPGNLSMAVQVDPNCSLSLGADLTVTDLDVRGTLNANGYAITVGDTLNLGTTTGPFALNNRGRLNVGNLNVSSQYSPTQTTFNLAPGDAVGGVLSLTGVNMAIPAGARAYSLSLNPSPTTPPVYSSVTTADVGNVTHDVTVGPGCTLALGADLNLVAGLTVYGTVDAGGHGMTTTYGTFTVYPGGTLTIGPSFSVPDLYVYGTVNAGGHPITASGLQFGSHNGGPWTLTDRGPLVVAGGLYVYTPAGQSPLTFNLTPADSVASVDFLGVNSALPMGVTVQQLFLSSNGATPPAYAAVSTASAGNVTKLVFVEPHCLLTLGADLTLSDRFLQEGTLNANGHAISANTIYMGYYAGPATFENDGPSTAGSWEQGNGTQVRLRQPGDVLGSLLVTQGAGLTVGDAAGQMTGPTIGNPTLTDLSIDPGSDLMLEVNGLAGGWVLRWANPTTGNHIADLRGLINGGEITFPYLNGGSYAFTTDPAYTYISVTGVPEPSALVLAVVAAGVIGLRRAYLKPLPIAGHGFATLSPR
jgi:hypothetical protein